MTTDGRARRVSVVSTVNKMSERMPDLVILPAHDPGAAERLAQATGQAPVALAG
jgi:hypothetical protein